MIEVLYFAFLRGVVAQKNLGTKFHEYCAVQHRRNCKYQGDKGISSSLNSLTVPQGRGITSGIQQKVLYAKLE